jgi:hypothetical protein
MCIIMDGAPFSSMLAICPATAPAAAGGGRRSVGYCAA